MTTKELIKELQKVDPEGNCHVMIGGMIPLGCDKLPGYYDGSYIYQKNGKYIISTKNCKVDIYCVDINDIIWNADGDYSMFEFDLNYVDNESKIKEDKSWVYWNLKI